MGLVCSFFGHRDAPSEVFPKIKEAILWLIEERGASRFLVGTHGAFDRMVYKALCEVRTRYPYIDVCVVLSALPTGAGEYDNAADTCVPEGLERVPRRAAIPFRNRWMVLQSDAVVTYVKWEIGGAAEAQRLARAHGRTVIPLI